MGHEIRDRRFFLSSNIEWCWWTDDVDFTIINSNTYLPFMFCIILFFMYEKNTLTSFQLLLVYYVCILSWFQHLLLVVDKYPYVYCIFFWYLGQKWLRNKMESGYFCHSNKKYVLSLENCQLPWLLFGETILITNFFLIESSSISLCDLANSLILYSNVSLYEMQNCRELYHGPSTLLPP